VQALPTRAAKRVLHPVGYGASTQIRPLKPSTFVWQLPHSSDRAMSCVVHGDLAKEPRLEVRSPLPTCIIKALDMRLCEHSKYPCSAAIALDVYAALHGVWPALLARVRTPD
jgi:hypothetical protein